MRIKARKYGPIWRYALILLVFGSPAAFGQAVPDSDDLASFFGSTTIIIEGEQDACFRFDVFVATRREQQVRGLMHVHRLPAFSGMLFIYEQPAMLSMWMKNTYIPLDILFIREDGTIADIVANTEPLSLASISATEPVSYVLELNAGVTDKLHIGAGSRIHL